MLITPELTEKKLLKNQEFYLITLLDTTLYLKNK